MNDSVTPIPPSLLYRWDYLVLSIGPSSQLKAHSHGAAELRISMDAPIFCRLSNNVDVEASSVLIPPGVQHQNRCEDAVSAVLYLDVESQDYEHLVHQMTGQGPVYVGLPNLYEARKALQHIVQTAPGLDDCLVRTRREILGSAAVMRKMDTRIAGVVRGLKGFPGDDRSVGTIAASVALSEDRLHHLFTREVGIPLHRFRLWLRLKNASHLFLEGSDLTTAAHDSGFADSAHLSRTFVKMYGAPPSRLLAQHKQNDTNE